RTLRGHVGDEQRGKQKAALLAEHFQGGEQLVLALPKLLEADLLDLRDAEFCAVLGIFLAVGGDGLRRGLEREQRTAGKQLFRKLTGVDFGKLFELLQNFRVARGRGRRGQVQRVGDEAGEQQSGDVARQLHVVAEKTVGDNCAGGADGFVAEENGLLRGQRAD